MSELAFGTKLWLSLVTYIVAADVYALFTDKETFSAALGRALHHPKRRWMVIVSWVLTTKHLFFGNWLKWLDPFALMALLVKVMKVISRR